MRVGQLARGAAMAMCVGLVLVGSGQAARTVNVATTAQLQLAISSAQTGDVIVVTAGGTYAPTATLNALVSLTLQAAPGVVATIDGASVVPDVDGNDDILATAPGTSVTVSNLTFTGAKQASDGSTFGNAINAAGALNLLSSTLTANAGLALWL